MWTFLLSLFLIMGTVAFALALYSTACRDIEKQGKRKLLVWMAGQHIVLTLIFLVSLIRHWESLNDLQHVLGSLAIGTIFGTSVILLWRYLAWDKNIRALRAEETTTT